MITNGKRIRASETAEKSESARSGGKRLAKKKEKPPREPWLKRLTSRIKPGKRRFRKLNGKEWLILLIPAVAAVIAVAVVLWMGRDAMTCTLEEAPCQFYAGSLYRIEEGAVLRRTSKGETLIKTSTGERELDSLPIYREERAVVTLTQDMTYYAPRSGQMARMEYFSELELSNGTVTARREEKSAPLEAGFLYDGNDFYLFLEPVILSFNGYKMELSALSYVEARYNGDIMVFDYIGKEFLIEAPTGAVTAQIKTGEYSISLLGDFMTTYEGARTLLFTRPELLDPVLN